MALLDAIAQFCGALKEGFSFARQRDAETNAPAMQANATAQTEAKIAAEATEAVASDDLEKIRSQAAE